MVSMKPYDELLKKIIFIKETALKECFGDDILINPNIVEHINCNRYPDGREDYCYDGVPLLRFFPIEIKENKIVQRYKFLKPEKEER